MEPSSLLLIIGDPVKDTYIEEEEINSRLETKEVLSFPGGSLNVYNNANKVLSCSGTLVLHAPEFPMDRRLIDYILNFKQLSQELHSEIYTILRTSNSEIEVALSPYREKAQFYSQVNLKLMHILSRNKHLFKDFAKIPKGLILSDYNKGILNRKVYATYPGTWFDFCIVDTKYRSVNVNLFNDCKLKIWHATNKEYCQFFARHFDYVIHTNGKEPVRLIQNGVVIKTFLIPNTQVVNTCGAGDTFTACFASFLLQFEQKELQSIVSAIEFAIDRCQEVVQLKYTATPKTKII